jgi:hypothetical protein
VAARWMRMPSVSPNVRGGVGDDPGPPETCGGAFTARYVRTRSSAAGLFTLTSTACSGKPVSVPVYAGSDALTNGWVLYIGLSPNIDPSCVWTAATPGAH